MPEPHRCPACDRVFRNVFDFPSVRIVAFDRLPIPEAMDTMSGAAMGKRIARTQAKKNDPADLLKDGINMTPQVEKACQTEEVAAYLSRLADLPGKEVSPDTLLPPWEANGYFKWAYPVADTDIFLSLNDPQPPAPDRGMAEVQVHCRGPNLGSAGGPTMQLLGSIAAITYQGLLQEDFQGGA